MSEILNHARNVIEGKQDPIETSDTIEDFSEKQKTKQEKIGQIHQMESDDRSKEWGETVVLAINSNDYTKALPYVTDLSSDDRRALINQDQINVKQLSNFAHYVHQVITTPERVKRKDELTSTTARISDAIGDNKYSTYGMSDEQAYAAKQRTKGIQQMTGVAYQKRESDDSGEDRSSTYGMSDEQAYAAKQRERKLASI